MLLLCAAEGAPDTLAEQATKTIIRKSGFRSGRRVRHSLEEYPAAPVFFRLAGDILFMRDFSFLECFFTIYF
jgi:hypothetical protein